MNANLTDEQFLSLINGIFEELFEVEPEKLRPEAHIFTDLGLDSIDMVDLMVALQQRTGTRLHEDERLRGIRTLGDLYGYILQIRQEGQAGPAAPAA